MSPSAASSAPVLSVAALRKSVPGGRLLFDRLHLSAKAGEVVAIMGESGVGKSTLLNLIAGLDVADAGGIAIEGVSLAGLGDDERTILRRDRIGFVFQAFHILPHLNLAQNIALPLVLAHAPGGKALQRAEAMLDAVGLAGRGQDYAAQLSGGELQRIAIARALVHRPALILADEPTGNLDPETGDRILRLFLTAVREAGAAALIVTHSEHAAGVADRTLVLTAEGLAPRHGG
jgi:putative ABC transport system ATP-binding protein